MSSADQTESNNAAVSSPAERRRHLRFPFSATVEAVETKSGTKLRGAPAIWALAAVTWIHLARFR